MGRGCITFNLNEYLFINVNILISYDEFSYNDTICTPFFFYHKKEETRKYSVDFPKHSVYKSLVKDVSL